MVLVCEHVRSDYLSVYEAAVFNLEDGVLGVTEHVVVTDRLVTSRVAI